MDKSPDAFRTISEVAELLETPAHVLRFWESRFPQIKPVKRAGGRRYYRPTDVALLSGIRRLLHEEGMTIRGVQKVLRDQGVRHVAGLTGSADDPDLDPLIAAIDLPVLPMTHDESKVVALTEWRSAVETGETPEALRNALRPALTEVTPPTEAEPPRQWSLFAPDDMPLPPMKAEPDGAEPMDVEDLADAPDPTAPVTESPKVAPIVESPEPEDTPAADIEAAPVQLADSTESPPPADASPESEPAPDAESEPLSDAAAPEAAPPVLAEAPPHLEMPADEAPAQESSAATPAPMAAERPWIAPDLRALPRLQDGETRNALKALRMRAIALHARLDALSHPRR